MIDSNGKLTDAAKEYLSPQEIELFNATQMQSSGWFLEKHAAATRLISAGIQRKALLQIEERGKTTTRVANIIAGLALTALVVDILVEVFKVKPA